jgi:nitrite reductase/ring-hydroxylating ferredoxin subunit/uncharacterized membrane protein
MADAPRSGPGESSGSALTTWHGTVFAAIADWAWLSALEERVSALSQPLYDRHRDNLVVELMHGGRWTGHSLHAALSDLPIGFWTGALVLDVVDELTGAASSGGRGEDGRLDAATTLSGAGLLAAAATLATGATDWTVSDGEDRRVGLLHGMLNLAATAVQGASLLARLTGHRRPAALLGLVSFGAVGAAGFIGGHLVQGRAVMVNRVAANSGPTRWVKALEEEKLAEGTLAGVVVEGRRVLLYRAGDDVHALDDVCTHAGGLLSRGQVAGCVVICPLHESKFDLRDGHIVRGPAHHPQPVLPARVRNGWIEVRGTKPRPRRTPRPENQPD